MPLIASRASPYLCVQRKRKRKHSQSAEQSVIRRAAKKKKRAVVPSRKDHGICIERTPVVKLQTVLGEAGNLGVILEFNLPIDDQLARANVCESGEFRDRS